MAIRKILEFPDPRLRTVATAVKQVDDSIRELIDDMIETMYSANGIGLAATQINVHKRIFSNGYFRRPRPTQSLYQSRN